MMPKCPYGDPGCPCQDGDACHYVVAFGSPAMAPPDIFTAARTIAQVFTAAGIEIHLPGEGGMDDAERGRWHACLDSAEAILRPRAASHETELVAVLREVMGWISNWSPNFEQDQDWPETRDRVDAAIAKVTGETKP